jgi:hypothetical protein
VRRTTKDAGDTANGVVGGLSKTGRDAGSAARRGDVGGAVSGAVKGTGQTISSTGKGVGSTVSGVGKVRSRKFVRSMRPATNNQSL